MQIRGTGQRVYEAYELSVSHEELEVLYRLLNQVNGYGEEPEAVIFVDWKPSYDKMTATQVKEILVANETGFLAQIEKLLYPEDTIPGIPWPHDALLEC